MADLIIRGLSDEVHAALKGKAAMAGKSLEAWLREQLAQLADQPTIRQHYRFKAWSESGASVSIKREIGVKDVIANATSLSQEQAKALKKVLDYVARNGPGDYEKAYALLAQHFDEVFPS